MITFIYTIINLLTLTIILFISYIIFTFIFTLFIDKTNTYTDHNKFYRFLLNSWTSIALFLCRIKIDLTINNELPKNTRIVVVGNHRSNYDPIITWKILKEYNLAYISKKSNFKVPLFGKIVRRCCFMEIDRDNPRNAAKTIEHAINLIDNNIVSIGVYPEGSRSKTGELLEFHNCVFKIAQRAKTPLVVVTLDHTEKIAKNTPFHKTIVKATVDVINYDAIKDLQTCEIGDIVKKTIVYNLEEEYIENENTLVKS